MSGSNAANINRCIVPLLMALSGTLLRKPTWAPLKAEVVHPLLVHPLNAGRDLEQEQGPRVEYKPHPSKLEARCRAQITPPVVLGSLSVGTIVPRKRDLQLRLSELLRAKRTFGNRWLAFRAAILSISGQDKRRDGRKREVRTNPDFLRRYAIDRSARDKGILPEEGLEFMFDEAAVALSSLSRQKLWDCVVLPPRADVCPRYDTKLIYTANSPFQPKGVFKRAALLSSAHLRATVAQYTVKGWVNGRWIDRR